MRLQLIDDGPRERELVMAVRPYPTQRDATSRLLLDEKRPNPLQWDFDSDVIGHPIVVPEQRLEHVIGIP